jgi:hypothetical protein
MRLAMSELRPINTGKKSQIYEEKRRREELARKKRREAERQRRLKIQRRKQRITLALLVAFISVCSVLIVVNVGSILSTDNTKKNTNQTKQAQDADSAEEVVSNSLDLSEIVLDDSMYIYENDPDMIQKLKDRLYSSETEDEKLEFIIENEAAYPPEMIEFLVKYEETIDFVLKYPIEINEDHTSVVDISDDYTKGMVPTFIQWDDRWGYISYGDNVIGDSGCGPTCLAMAVVALTGRAQYTPIAICKFAEDNGYYVDGVGTSWDLMKGGVEKLGLNSTQISVSEESIRQALKEDKLVILSMGPGIFTYTGHFILVYKYEDGLFYVKDPNSRERTDTGFSYEEIGSQIKGGWAIYDGDDD